MEKYNPPFSITNKMLQLVASISEKVGQLSYYNDFKSKPHLRKNSRIRSIHSSLKIEANSLSLKDVKEVIDGKTVYGPQNEIQEVKNAYKAYEQMMSVNPYSISDLLMVHSIMTDQLIDESGRFRTGGEGVFDESGQCIFIAPPPHLVNELVNKLFNWMKESKEIIHPLIVSSVFHYEFVFIHPFKDGNGRMARLWQNVILASWKPIFQYLPIESQIEKYQDDYYKAIDLCNKSGESTLFIEFELEMINQTIDSILIQLEDYKYNSEYVDKLMKVMEYDVPYKASEIMDKLHLKSKETFRKNYINPAIEENLVVMSIPDKPTSKNQRYIKK